MERLGTHDDARDQIDRIKSVLDDVNRVLETDLTDPLVGVFNLHFLIIGLYMFGEIVRGGEQARIFCRVVCIWPQSVCADPPKLPREDYCVCIS